MSKNKQRKTKPVRKRPIPESLQGQVYLDPRYDTGFKELFDSESALKDFFGRSPATGRRRQNQEPHFHLRQDHNDAFCPQQEGDPGHLRHHGNGAVHRHRDAEGRTRLLYRQGCPLQGLLDHQGQAGDGTDQGVPGTSQGHTRKQAVRTSGDSLHLDLRL